MTTEEGAESATVETNAGASGAPVSSEATERNYEDTARKLGWVPEDEFKGDRKPERFKSAKEFVEDTSPSVLKVFERLEKDFEDRFKKLERVGQKTLKAVKEGYEAQITDLKSQKTAAVKAGNVELVQRIDNAIDATKEAAKDEGDSPIEENVNAAFKKSNPWYGDDDDLTALAIMQSNAVSQAYTLKHGKPMPDKEMLEAVERKVKASPEYKAKFSKTSANGHADVDGGSDDPGPSRGDPLAKLSAIERATAKADMKANPKIYPTAEKWLEAYNS